MIEARAHEVRSPWKVRQ